MPLAAGRPARNHDGETIKHARLSWGRVEAERWDEFERAFDSRIGSVGPIDGLRARLLLRDARSPDIGFAMSIWENEIAMRSRAVA